MTPICTPVTEAASRTRGPWLSPRAQIALTACACGGASAFLYAVDPSRHGVYPECLLYNTTGIYCAGCGATRALYALLHGRVLEALHDNAIFVAALPLLIYTIFPYALRAWNANTWPQVDVDGGRAAWKGTAIILLMIVFMLLRNLPGWPFEWLRPVG